MTRPALICSFCGASEFESDPLIAGPGGVNICDGCVDLCVDLVSEKRGISKAHREMFWGDIGVDPRLALGWCR